MNNSYTMSTKLPLTLLWATILWSEAWMVPTIAQAKESPFFQGITFPIFPGTVPQPGNVPANTATPVYPLVEVPTPGLEKLQSTSSVKKRRNRIERSTNVEPSRRRRIRRPRVNQKG